MGRVATTPRHIARPIETALLLTGFEACLRRPTRAGRARQLESDGSVKKEKEKIKKGIKEK